MSDEKVVSIGVVKKFQIEQDLFDEILACIHQHDGDVSLVSVIGILHLVQDTLKAECQ